MKKEVRLTCEGKKMRSFPCKSQKEWKSVLKGFFSDSRVKKITDISEIKLSFIFEGGKRWEVELIES